MLVRYHYLLHILSTNYNLGSPRIRLVPYLLLDPQQVWRSHDPMSVQNFDFCEEKKSDYPPFFHFV